jgi:hypothetical protein
MRPGRRRASASGVEHRRFVNKGVMSTPQPGRAMRPRSTGAARVPDAGAAQRLSAMTCRGGPGWVGVATAAVWHEPASQSAAPRSTLAAWQAQRVHGCVVPPARCSPPVPTAHSKQAHAVVGDRTSEMRAAPCVSSPAANRADSAWSPPPALSSTSRSPTPSAPPSLPTSWTSAHVTRATSPPLCGCAVAAADRSGSAGCSSAASWKVDVVEKLSLSCTPPPAPLASEPAMQESADADMDACGSRSWGGAGTAHVV